MHAILTFRLPPPHPSNSAPPLSPSPWSPFLQSHPPCRSTLDPSNIPKEVQSCRSNAIPHIFHCQCLTSIKGRGGREGRWEGGGKGGKGGKVGGKVGGRGEGREVQVLENGYDWPSDINIFIEVWRREL